MKRSVPALVLLLVTSCTTRFKLDNIMPNPFGPDALTCWTRTVSGETGWLLAREYTRTLSVCVQTNRLVELIAEPKAQTVPVRINYREDSGTGYSRKSKTSLCSLRKVGFAYPAWNSLEYPKIDALPQTYAMIRNDGDRFRIEMDVAVPVISFNGSSVESRMDFLSTVHIKEAFAVDATPIPTSRGSVACGQVGRVDEG